ncbi:hypothetical protein D9757_011885 [Collybiopsis confluens]|uniref:Carboxylesterase type B domain-containing protein n=1 Tax=Collybiopsis confluens TaxID=2823264 RepID=A0A8H5LRE6_9AGAR|nr:hypothetical protein D9757_011885 [Collybiopsis confluens]
MIAFMSRFPIGSQFTLAVVLLATCPLVFSSALHTVSLLFENDGNWEQFGNRSSALLIYDAVSSNDALAICDSFNETLLSPNELSEYVSTFRYFRFPRSLLIPNTPPNSSVSQKLLYLQHLGQFNGESEFWVAAPDSSVTPVASTPSLSGTSGTSTNQSDANLPVLCSNSAAFTSQVDTDFSTSPRTNVTSNGIVFTGVRDHMTFRFMGVPYAAPPLDSLRFQYPERWDGTHVDATGCKYHYFPCTRLFWLSNSLDQPACLQFGFFANNDLGLNPWGTSEDCLYLNVYTTYIPSSTSASPEQLRPVSFVRTQKLSLPTNQNPNKPLRFWIHGGGNTSGTGSDSTFDGASLATRGDVVVVTINHRLNIFGFLGLNSSTIPGNYGMADKIAALQWVQDHIADFGGDPERVTIFGQSAGGSSVVDLLKSPKAAGLFQRAISESGGAGSSKTPAQASAAYLPVLAPFCKTNSTGTAFLQCLQALPAETLLGVTSVASSWTTIIDGVYALDTAVHQMGLGPSAVNSVPFLLGFMPEEGQSLLGTAIAPSDTNFTRDLVTAVDNATINAYTDWHLTCPAENMIASALGSQAFPALYVYTMQHAYGLNYFNPYDLCTFPVGTIQPYYRCHSGDLYQVFGTYYLFDQPVRVPQDIAFTALIQDLWTTFARTGNPNPDQDDLAARGPAYESTLQILQEANWIWQAYDTVTMSRASLDYPNLANLQGLPDAANGRCAVVS